MWDCEHDWWCLNMAKKQKMQNLWTMQKLNTFSWWNSHLTSHSVKLQYFNSVNNHNKIYLYINRMTLLTDIIKHFMSRRMRVYDLRNLCNDFDQLCTPLAFIFSAFTRLTNLMINWNSCYFIIWQTTYSHDLGFHG